jgi:cytidyltransferase-like protein
MAAGVIAEFNPFHNGHKYLLEQAAKTDEYIVVIMSGSFVQRGDMAITDKWTRTRAALNGGADLVIELPVVFSLNTAQKFAFGAVSTLKATGVINTLVFGSECGEVNELKKAAELMLNEPEEVSAEIKELIKSGKSYPSARAKAYGNCGADVLSSPNDILGAEYIRAARQIGMTCEFVPVKRVGPEHDSSEIHQSTASASEIRRIIRSGGDITDFIPMSADFPIYDSSRLDAAIIAKLRTCGSEYLSNINDVGEGLENRFIAAASVTHTLDSLCKAVKTKRYTLSRIRRIAWSSYLGLTKELCSLSPSYIRILGMNDKGKAILKQMKKTASLPIVVKAADYKNDRIFDINSAAEDIFSLCAPKPALRNGGRDIRVSPVII